MPTPPSNRDQYINDPDGNISNRDRIILYDALLSQSSIVHSAPSSSTQSGHLIRPLEPIDDIYIMKICTVNPNGSGPSRMPRLLGSQMHSGVGPGRYSLVQMYSVAPALAPIIPVTQM